MKDHVAVSISIDTEEDNWGSYAREGATATNVSHLRELQDLFDRYGARPTYLVNYAPLVSRESVDVLGDLGARDSVEIGAHCHPWNTPPHYSEDGPGRSMMNLLTLEENREKIRSVSSTLEEELGIRPKSFRAGRWGLGPTVARALADEGYEVDASVSPFIDWSSSGGPDYSVAPHDPYRFSPSFPLQPVPDGVLVELPTTVGFLKGEHRRANRLFRLIQQSWLAKLKVLGAADRTGFLTRRWLSPEGASSSEMVRLIDNYVRSGTSFLQLTFHSCTLLPGATPFVRDEYDRTQFLHSIDRVLRHCRDSGLVFRTLSEVGRSMRPEAQPASE